MRLYGRRDGHGCVGQRRDEAAATTVPHDQGKWVAPRSGALNETPGAIGAGRYTAYGETAPVTGTASGSGQ